MERRPQPTKAESNTDLAKPWRICSEEETQSQWQRETRWPLESDESLGSNATCNIPPVSNGRFLGAKRALLVSVGARGEQRGGFITSNPWWDKGLPPLTLRGGPTLLVANSRVWESYGVSVSRGQGDPRCDPICVLPPSC